MYGRNIFGIDYNFYESGFYDIILLAAVHCKND